MDSDNHARNAEDDALLKQQCQGSTQGVKMWGVVCCMGVGLISDSVVFNHRVLFVLF